MSNSNYSMEEHWKVIEDAPLFEISTLGNVRHTDTHEPKPVFLHDGKYFRLVTSNHRGHKKAFYIHILVAKAFIPNPENKPIVDHKSRRKSDNTVENLRWVTIQENRLNGHRYEKPDKLYKGVYWRESAYGWTAYLNTYEGCQEIGHAKTEREVITLAIKATNLYLSQMALEIMP